MNNTKTDQTKTVGMGITEELAEGLQKISLYYFREILRNGFSPNYLSDSEDTIKSLEAVQKTVLEAFDNMSLEEKMKMMDNWSEMELEEDIENEPRYSRADIKELFEKIDKQLNNMILLLRPGSYWAIQSAIEDIKSLLTNELREFLDEGGDSK